MTVIKQNCIVLGLDHIFQFVIAAYGYQCFECAVCGYPDDVIEDSQP